MKKTFMVIQTPEGNKQFKVGELSGLWTALTVTETEVLREDVLEGKYKQVYAETGVSFFYSKE